MKLSFRSNFSYYRQEALGLGIFMVSACLFSAFLFSYHSPFYSFFNNDPERNIVMGLMMGLTALFIFYSPFTAASGSQINPAVTLSFLRLGKMCPWDALFYILFQLAGGTVAVYLMQFILGGLLTDPPVNTAVTIPTGSVSAAVFTEFIIAFITMNMVLFTSANSKLKKYTRVFSAILVFCWVNLAGPVSGFGMNPARSFASALPADIWTSFWIYLFVPVAGMLLATECYLRFNGIMGNIKTRRWQRRIGIL